mgnify:CR=1 FL=1
MPWVESKWCRLALVSLGALGITGLAPSVVQAQSSDWVVGGVQILAASSLGFSGTIVGIGVGGSLGGLLFAPIGLVDRSCLTAATQEGNCVLLWMMRGFELGSKLGMVVGLSSGAALGAQAVSLAFSRSGNFHGAFVGALIGGVIGLGTDFFSLNLLEMSAQGFQVEFRLYNMRSIVLAAIGATIGSHWR